MTRLTLLHRRLRRLLLSRRRLLSAVAAAVAVAAALQATSAPPPATTAVLTAARDIPAGSVVRPGDLTSVAFRPESVPSGVLRSAEAALGRTTAAPIRAGEPLTDVRLLADSLVARYPGTVAAPVRITDAGAVDLLRVGDRVDVIAADPQGERAPRLVASEVPVVGLPAEVASTPGLVNGGLVVLAVSQRTAQDLAAASVSAYLSIAITR